MATLARCTKRFVRYLRDTRAVSALEYAILTGIIAVAIAAAFHTFSETMEKTLKDMATEISGKSK